jgi:hypothetical protein
MNYQGAMNRLERGGTVMKLARSILTSLVIVTTSFPVFGQSAPEGFRDLKWGATQEQVSLAFPAALCHKTTGEVIGDWTCALRYEAINDADVRVYLYGYDTGDTVGMSSFTLSFKSNDVQRIVDAFESRYGRAHQVEQKEFLTQGGGRFPNAVWQWRFPEVSITISQHSWKLGDALARVGLVAALKELQVRSEERKRKAGKGL